MRFSLYSLSIEVFPSVIEDAISDLRNSRANIGTMNCKDKLPDSGKSIYERFKLSKLKKHPTVIFTVNDRKPEVLEAKYLEVSSFAHLLVL